MTPLRRLRCFSLALYFYAVITHFYSQGFSVDAEEFGCFIDLEMKVMQGFFDMFFLHIYQGYPACGRIHHRGFRLIVLPVVKYIGHVDNLVVTEHTEAREKSTRA